MIKYSKMFQVYVCIECESEFCASASLMRHMLAVHAGEKPYQCQECEQAFANAQTLKRHMRVCNSVFLST